MDSDAPRIHVCPPYCHTTCPQPPPPPPPRSFLASLVAMRNPFSHRTFHHQLLSCNYYTFCKHHPII
ncbi:hypothetical protein OH77DRAFT_1417133 [Trametes cingulata]|nr:hypothetical protein OH77DRAFT_1417133 [Trametes cingulata]